MRSSYTLKTEIVEDEDTNPNPARIDGPSLDTYPPGYFVNDYKYTFQQGDLDAYNGRFCKTPDYPCLLYTSDAADE